ncbi:LysR substrate-binding domain-containing protein [Phenylobacterium sp.]|uniref:LysR substrate-binding domain-containing protein n=1 Tax=Phenylobacterium sp. TaxID=1871053 RepID=UPI002811FBEC|nr:LysR substrate-binding domain-containing protein [Phenylobacterium sp.]
MPVRPPSLRAIAAFEAAARHQSFSKAAEELNLTRSAISHAIRTLEERLAVDLFTRTGPSVMLTEAGRTFAGRLRLSLEMISQAFDLSARTDRAVLRVGAPADLMQRVVALGLAGLRTSHPDLDIELRAQGGVSDLLSGTVDVVVAQGASAPVGLQARLLAREALVPVAAPGVFARLPARPEEVVAAPLIHCPARPWGLWLEAAGLDRMRSGEALKVDDLACAIELARAGAGVCLAPRLLVQDDLRQRRLVRVSDIEAYLPDGYWALWGAASPKAELIDLFAERLRHALSAPPEPELQPRAA